MKLAIMQPYFMPYLGYWQLMNAVDRYVVYDDVNYIKGGWINRNRILVNGQAEYFNLPILGGSPNKKINEVKVNQDNIILRKRLRTIEFAYKKAPYFDDVYPLMVKILSCREENLSDYILNSFRIIGAYLGITTELIVSSAVEKETGLSAQEKVLSICRLLGAAEYINPIGGRKLYSYSAFRKQGICLKFLTPCITKYKQYNGEFQENLSIIDVLMFNSREAVKEKLGDYTLITD